LADKRADEADEATAAEESQRNAFFTAVAQPWVDEPVELAELYKVPVLGKLGGMELTLGPGVLGAAGHGLAHLWTRAFRAATRRPHDVVVALTASTVVLLRATAGASHGWRAVGLVGQWFWVAVRVETAPYDMLILRAPGDRTFRLMPAGLTPGAFRMARLLSHPDGV
jgi:hypothetical protein